MSGQTDEHDVVTATQTVAVLDAQAEVLRAELATLRHNLAETKRDISELGSALLLQANEQLAQAARRAETIAEIAAHNLVKLVRPDEPGARTDASAKNQDASIATSASSDQSRSVEHGRNLRELREANQQLVIAALTSQELEADAKKAHLKQIKFMAMVAHELRNPLTPIRIAAGLLVNRKPQGEIPLSRLQVIIDGQVTHMTRLIDDLLDGSRISTGKLRLEHSSADLSEIIQRTAETCRPALDLKHQQLTLTLPDGPTDIIGDPIRLTQVFSNLLDNASKYTPANGEIVVVMTTLAGAMVITVLDNGIGITADALPTIFDLFVQDPLALVHANGGLGIGLAVARELVEAHGGTISCSSAGTGRGSEFIITLPRNR